MTTIRVDKYLCSFSHSLTNYYRLMDFCPMLFNSFYLFFNAHIYSAGIYVHIYIYIYIWERRIWSKTPEGRSKRQKHLFHRKPTGDIWDVTIQIHHAKRKSNERLLKVSVFIHICMFSSSSIIYGYIYVSHRWHLWYI